MVSQGMSMSRKRLLNQTHLSGHGESSPLFHKCEESQGYCSKLTFDWGSGNNYTSKGHMAGSHSAKGTSCLYTYHQRNQTS